MDCGRIQYSAYSGQISNNRREELTYRLRHTLGQAVGSIKVFAICERDLALMKELTNQHGHATSD